MSVDKILGIETEYGIVHRGVPDPDPISASALLINAYLDRVSAASRGPNAPRPGWDFIDESPDHDARGFVAVDGRSPAIEMHMVNAVLTNGARYYVDHAHPEMSSPECADPLSAVLYDQASDHIMVASMEAAKEILPEGQELVVYKNNSDGKGNSYGCHENYLVDRAVPFEQIVSHATAHFVSRQIFTGAGKVGCEIPGSSRHQVPFQITQRADFFEEPVGLETTLKRPIINTRDEPHADPLRYRRLHVIVGDANLCQVATFLKIGTTALLLAMVEEGMLDQGVRFADPVRALQQVSFDLTLRQPLLLEDGTSVTALSLQWSYYEKAAKYLERFGNKKVGGATAELVMERWHEVLTALEQSDRSSLIGVVDWVTKQHLLTAYQERQGLAAGDIRLAAVDLQYHDLRPARSLFARLGAETLVDQRQVATAMLHPPKETRAYFRGRCLEKWPDQVVAANWDSLVFETAQTNLQRIPMMEPTRGTEKHVGPLLDQCATVIELLDHLKAGDPV